ncbi:MAG: MSMEG_4193 family putative phosphomutase [Actinomycetota bacterium]
MSLLLLIRHALADGTGKKLTGWTPGVHLSRSGARQAEALAGRLESLPVAAVYSSPLERCLETARPLAASKGLRIRSSKDLGEVDYGEWTGRPLSRLSKTKLWRTVQTHPATARFPGGESLLEVQQRATNEAERIAGAHPNELVVLVTHGDVIRLLLAHFAGVHTDLFQRIIVGPASVSAVAVGNEVPRILRTNDTGDLADLAGPRKR